MSWFLNVSFWHWIELLCMIKFYLTVCLLLNHLTNETSLVIKDYKMLTIFLSIFNFKEMSYSELKKISSHLVYGSYTI